MKSIIQKLSYKHKNNKFQYYSRNLLRQLIPNIFFRIRLTKKLATVTEFDDAYIKKRVNYYNKLKTQHELHSGIPLSKFKLKKESKVYFFDCYEYTRYFSSHLKVNFLFGDITYTPKEPSITKSRPVHGDNSNSIILKLNKVRHFIFTNDQKDFLNKKDLLIGRGRIARVHRIKFYEMYFNHPLCNIGQTNKGSKHDHWWKPKMTIDEQLDFKFILCLEGNDVASNLKWVMSSNSLAVMPKPKFETWFMEGTLIQDYHYISLKDDFSDLEEKLTYYITHKEEALKIVANANDYIEQFKNKKQEDLISLLVLEKYFYKTGQSKPKNTLLFDA